MRLFTDRKRKLWVVSSFLSMSLLTQRPDSHLVMLMSTKIHSVGDQDHCAWMISVHWWYAFPERPHFGPLRRTLSSPWRVSQRERTSDKQQCFKASGQEHDQKVSIRQNQYISLYLLLISTRLKRIRTWTCNGKKNWRRNKRERYQSDSHRRTLCPDILELTSKVNLSGNRWYTLIASHFMGQCVQSVDSGSKEEEFPIFLHLQGRHSG